MSKNDYARLKKEADIAQVVQWLGLEVNKKGSAFFIHCPLPDHNDQHATNCYFREGWNNIYCTVCCKAVNAIDLIMLETGMEYGEAADQLWELEGRPNWYYKDWKTENKVPEFTLNREDARLIGIHFPGRVLSAIGVSDSKPSNGYTSEAIADGSYLKCMPEHLSWRDFMTENQYRVLCINKARETRMKCVNAAKHCSGSLQDAFLETAMRCAEIEKSCMKKAVA